MDHLIYFSIQSVIDGFALKYNDEESWDSQLGLPDLPLLMWVGGFVYSSGSGCICDT